MAGMFITRLVDLITCAGSSTLPLGSEKNPAAQITHCSSVPFSLTPIARLATLMLFIGLRRKHIKPVLISHAMRKFLRHYQLTQVEVFTTIGPWTETLIARYSCGSPKDSNVLVFATDFTLTTRLRLTLHRYYEPLVFCTLAYSDSSKLAS